MRVYTHISRSTGQRFSLSVRYVLFRFGIPILLRHSKVNNVNYIGRLGACSADEEVVGLDVSVDQILLVNGLDSRQLWIGEYQLP